MWHLLTTSPVSIYILAVCCYKFVLHEWMACWHLLHITHFGLTPDVRPLPEGVGCHRLHYCIP